MSLTYLYIIFVIFLNDCNLIFGRNFSCSTSSDLSRFEDEILFIHNIIRSSHEETEPLCWSKNLAEDAQLWADKLAENSEGIIKPSNYLVVGDSDSSTIIRYGENMYRGSIFRSISPESAAQDSVRSWNNQEHNYNYNFDTAGISDKTKEFTQVVWRSTTKLGCGYSIKEHHFFIVVCEYLKTGNEGSRSQYNDNVREKITCELHQFAHGSVQDEGPFYLEQSISVECDAGFQLEGAERGVCTEDGWDFGDNEPRCTGCIVPDIDFGTPSLDVGSVVADGGYVNYSCNDGYNLDDAMRVIECSGNDLANPVPRCRKELHCLRPMIEHGWAGTPSDDNYSTNEEYGHNIPAGDNITIICKFGYELVGNRTAVCVGKSFGDVGSCAQSDASAMSDSSPVYHLATAWAVIFACILAAFT